MSNQQNDIIYEMIEKQAEEREKSARRHKKPFNFIMETNDHIFNSILNLK